MKVIRLKDKYNFCLAEKLDEPRVVKIKDREIVYKYKNLEQYYGNLYGAIRGFIIHNKLDASIFPVEEFRSIKPNSDSELYMPFLEVRDVLNRAKLS